MTLASGALALGLSSCATNDHETVTEETTESEPEVVEEEQIDLKEFEHLALDMNRWRYDERNDVYYQLGITYCLQPGSTSYESLAIFVPGAYFIGKQLGRGKTYACEIDETAKVGSFTPKTAPILLPINSGILAAQQSPTAYSYDGLAPYLTAGCVYVYAGFRGRNAGYENHEGSAREVFSGGAPWPLVDLKAAVRFLRYNATVLPCDVSRVFTFGFSGGGGISTLMGASGDAELYDPYLEQIGAATHDIEGEPLSDATYGSASWCPITSFDTADGAYEWMMGQYCEVGTRQPKLWTHLLSLDLARSYAKSLNDMSLTDEADQPLTLDESEQGVFAAGSYYDYLVAVIQNAADTFFAQTTFPYTSKLEHLQNASFPGDPSLVSLGAGATEVENAIADASAVAAETDSGSPIVFATDTDYVNALNSDSWWFTYNQRRGTAFITSIGDFVRHMRLAAKDVCAFDSIERSSFENQLFGIDDASSLHFSQAVCDQLVAGREAYAKAEGWDDVYLTDWTGDLTELDTLEQDMKTRVAMFNPLHFLCSGYEGYGTATVAPHWRINSGLFQTDTSLCTETNLVLALRRYEGLEDVTYNPIWGQGHTLAELTGTAEENLLSWVDTCCAAKEKDEQVQEQESAAS